MREWPLFGLRVVTPRVELRYPDDELAAAVAARTAEPIHDPAVMPFGLPWTDEPPEDLPRNSLQYLWRERGNLTAESWSLPLAVLVDGEVVGVQGLVAREFSATGTVETGSWLVQAVQGRGIGTAMRLAALHLAFAGLGARYALTGAWHDNAASLSVTAKVGYEPNGEEIAMRRDVADRRLWFRMTRERWEEVAPDRAGMEIHGLEPCLALLGAG